MDQSKVFSKGERYIPKGGQMPSESSNIYGKSSKYGEKQKGDHRFRGRLSQHWMVLNIQASVSGSICQFL